MLKLQPLLFLLVLFGSETAGLDIPIISDMQDIISLAHDIGDIASGNVPLLSFFTGAKPDPVQQKLAGLSKQIEDLTAAFNVKIDNALSQILTNVPRETDFRVRMNQMGGYMARISALFKMYQQIVKAQGNFNEYSTEQFMDVATSLQLGDVIETQNQMHRLFTGQQDDDTQESLMQLAAPVYRNLPTSSLCGKGKSRQQRAYDLYRTVVVTDVKGFIMTSYAYGMLRAYRNSSFEREIRIAEEGLITRVRSYLETTKVGLTTIPRDIYICDPPVHINGKTFVDMTRAIQLTVYHEEMLESAEVCQGQCRYKDTTTIYHETYNGWQPTIKCEGRINECRDLYETYLCEFDDEDYSEHVVYIKSDTLGTFGDSTRCGLAVKSSLSSYLSTFHYCEPCLCLCVEQKKNSTAVRTFNLRPQVSDIENNMVVTGVSFYKQDKVIHIQIEQGKLIAEGKIEEGSAKWVPVDEFIYKPELGSEGGFQLWYKYETHDLVENEDYAFINYDRRKIQFDDLTSLGGNSIVTGVKLKVSKRDPNAISLSIRLTQFNFTTGQVTGANEEKRYGEIDKINTKIISVWVDHDFIYQRKSEHYTKDRTVIDVTNKKDPLKSYGHVPASEDYSEIKLTYSDERDDVGQTTIPYFDMQRSGPMPRVALDGLGLYYRGNEKSGGFISIKTFTHDLSKYLNPEIDANALRPVEVEDIEEDEGLEELD